MPRRQRKNARHLAAAQRRVQVARLYHEFTRDPAAREAHPRPQAEIATRLGVAGSTISKDLDALRIEWRTARLETTDAIVGATISECEWVKAEARAEWQRSKTAAETTVTEQRAGNSLGDKHAKMQKIVKAQCGDPRYLQTILAAEDTKIRLTVGFKPTKVAPTTPDGDQAYAGLSDEVRAERIAVLLATALGRKQDADPAA